MFSKVNLITGAIGIRLTRFFKIITKKPDVVFVNEQLGFGGYTDYEKLTELGITSILDLRNETKTPHVNNRFSYYKIGIPDGHIPTEEQIFQIRNWIKKKIVLGETIFIHCNLGRGRATLITSLYLGFEGKDFKTIMKLIKKRKFVYLNEIQLKCLKDHLKN